MKRTTSFVEFDRSDMTSASTVAVAVEQSVAESTAASSSITVAPDTTTVIQDAYETSHEEVFENENDDDDDDWDQHLILAGGDVNEEDVSPLPNIQIVEKAENGSLLSNKMKKSVSFSHSFVVVQLEYVSPEYVPTPPNNACSNNGSDDDEPSTGTVPRGNNKKPSIADRMAELEAMQWNNCSNNNDGDNDNFLADNEGPKAFSIMDVFAKLQSIQADETAEEQLKQQQQQEGAGEAEAVDSTHALIDEHFFMAHDLMNALTKMATGTELHRIPAAVLKQVQPADDSSRSPAAAAVSSPAIQTVSFEQKGVTDSSASVNVGGEIIKVRSDSDGVKWSSKPQLTELEALHSSIPTSTSSGVINRFGLGLDASVSSVLSVNGEAVSTSSVKGEEVDKDDRGKEDNDRSKDDKDEGTHVNSAHRITSSGDDALEHASRGPGEKTTTTVTLPIGDQPGGAPVVSFSAADLLRSNGRTEEASADLEEVDTKDDVHHCHQHGDHDGGDSELDSNAAAWDHHTISASMDSATAPLSLINSTSTGSSGTVAAGTGTGKSRAVFRKVQHGKFPAKLDPIPILGHLPSDLSLESFNSEYLYASERTPDGDYTVTAASAAGTARAEHIDPNSGRYNAPQHFSDLHAQHLKNSESDSLLSLHRKLSDGSHPVGDIAAIQEEGKVNRPSSIATQGVAFGSQGVAFGSSSVAAGRGGDDDSYKLPLSSTGVGSVKMRVDVGAYDIDVPAVVPKKKKKGVSMMDIPVTDSNSNPSHDGGASVDTANQEAQALPPKKKKKGVSMRDVPAIGNEPLVNSSMVDSSRSAPSLYEGGRGLSSPDEATSTSAPDVKEPGNHVNLSSPKNKKNPVSMAPKSPAAELKEKTKPGGGQSSSVTSKGDFIRYQRLCRRAEVAIDISCGLESYKPMQTIGYILLAWFVAPTIICILTYGFIPYGYLGERTAWAISLIPWAVIMPLAGVLSVELYSVLISEIEFRVALSEQSVGVYVLAAIAAALAAIIVECVIFGSWHPAQGHSWLLMIAAGSSAVLTILIREFSLSAKMLTIEDRRASTKPFLSFLVGLFAVLPCACICYVVYIIGFSELNNDATRPDNNNGQRTAYAMACCFPLIRMALVKFVQDSFITKWGSGSMGQLCAGELAPLIAAAWHASFLSLVVGCVTTPWQTVALGAVEVAVQCSALARIAYLPQISSHIRTTVGSDDDNNNNNENYSSSPSSVFSNKKFLFEGAEQSCWNGGTSCSSYLRSALCGESSSSLWCIDWCCGGAFSGSGSAKVAAADNDNRRTSSTATASPGGMIHNGGASPNQAAAGGDEEAPMSNRGTTAIIEETPAGEMIHEDSSRMKTTRGEWLEGGGDSSNRDLRDDSGNVHVVAMDIEAGFHIETTPVTVHVEKAPRKHVSPTPCSSSSSAAVNKQTTANKTTTTAAVMFLPSIRTRTVEDDRTELDTATWLIITWISGIAIPLVFLACSAVLSVGPNRGIFGGYVSSEETWYRPRLWSVNIFRYEGNESVIVGDSMTYFGDSSKNFFWAPPTSSNEHLAASALVWKLLGMSAFHVVMMMVGSRWLCMKGTGTMTQFFCLHHLSCLLVKGSKNKYADPSSTSPANICSSEEEPPKNVSQDVLGLISEHNYIIVGLSVTLSVVIVFSVVFPWYGMNMTF